MGIFHCKLKNHSRNGGKNAKADKGGKVELKSVVAKAAYRAGENLYDERYDTTHRYANRQKTGDIIHTGIYTRAGDKVPDWVQNRQELWNRVEGAETRKDARLAKEVVIALPYELTPDEMISNVENYVANTITKYGAVADVSIHGYGRGYNPNDKNEKQAALAQEKVAEWKEKNIPFLTREEAEKTQRRHVKIETDEHGAITGYKLYQPHAHVMMTTRAITAEGFEKTKCNYLNRKEQLYNWRYGWEQQLNRSFKEMGLEIRVSAAKNEPASNDDNYCTDGNDNEKIIDFAYQLQEYDLKYRKSYREDQKKQREHIKQIKTSEERGQKAAQEIFNLYSPNQQSRLSTFQQGGLASRANHFDNVRRMFPTASESELLSMAFTEWGKRYDQVMNQQTKKPYNSGYSPAFQADRELER